MTTRGPLRRLAAPVLALTLALAASACASRQATADPEPGDAASAAPEEGAFPATVEHKFGETTVPAAPQRVVSVGYKEQDWLYEFGVSPVAVREWYGYFDHEVNPWAADLVEGEPPVVMSAELDVEQVAAQRPDLIVAVYSGITRKEYDQLSQIAPTIAGPVGSEDFDESWQDMTTLIGGALGQPERAEEIIDEIDGLFATAREEHPELVGAEVGVWSAWGEDTTGIYSSTDPRSQLMAELGLVSPPQADEIADGEFWGAVSGELVGDTMDGAADAVIVIGGGSTKAEPGARSVLADNPTFATSRVEEEGRVVLVDTRESDVAFSFVSPLSIRYTLEHLVPQLVAAVDGDPATEVPVSPGA
jgi:iron complex transport system substrate-binding protein